MEAEVGKKMMGGGLMERGESFKFDPNKSFRKQRKRPTPLLEEESASMLSPSGNPAQSPTPMAASLRRTGTGARSSPGLVRAKTSIGFHDGREKGRLPARLSYIHRVTYGDGKGEVYAPGASSASILPEIQRPPEYAELAELLQSVSETMSGSSASLERRTTWISTKEGFRGSWPRARAPPPARSRPSSRANSRPSSRGDSRPVSQSGSARLLVPMAARQKQGEDEKQNPLKVYQPSPESEAYLPAKVGAPSLSRASSAKNVVAVGGPTVSRQGGPPSKGQVASSASASASTAMLTLRPITNGKKASLDELDMQAIKTSGQQAAFPELRKGETIDITKFAEDQVAAESLQARMLKGVQGEINAVEVTLPADSPVVRRKLGDFARGDARSVVPKVRLFPQAKIPVWSDELKRTRKEYESAVWMQKSWRRYIRRKKYKLYIINKAGRSVQLLRSILQVWLRVARQAHVMRMQQAAAS